MTQTYLEDQPTNQARPFTLEKCQSACVSEARSGFLNPADVLQASENASLLNVDIWIVSIDICVNLFRIYFEFRIYFVMYNLMVYSCAYKLGP